MNRLLALFAWALVPILATESLAQAGDGYVGLYTDAAGTTPCTTVLPLSGTTLYVIANLEGVSTAGISGVEFRIEVENPAGWVFSYTAPAANIVIGNALDLNPQDPDDGSGVSIAFGACREPVAGNVPLGTLSVFNITGSATRLFVKRHSAPSNSGYQCPLFTLCNDPVFSMSCMTPTTEPPCSLSVAKPMPLSTSADPIVFTSTLNAASEQQIDPGMADQQVLAMFAPGIIQLPQGQSAATLATTTINSTELVSAFQAYGVSFVARAFPDAPPFPEFTELYRLVLPDMSTRDSLASLLAGMEGVVYANRNGGAALSPVYESEPMEQMSGSNGIGRKTDHSDVVTSPCTVGPPDYECTRDLAECPDDFYWGAQWGLVNAGYFPLGMGGYGNCFVDMGIDWAWNVTKGSGITIELLGAGVSKSHPDMLSRIEGEEGIKYDTGLAGVMVAIPNNTIGIAGLNWFARARAHHVADTIGGAGDDTAILQALGQVAASQNRIVVNAFHLVDGAGNHRRSDLVRVALRNLYMDNRFLIAPMGGGSCPSAPCVPAGDEYPAAYKLGVVSVGASTGFGVIWSFSKTGSHVDLVAPGERIWSTRMEGDYVPYTGTAIAAANAAGAASLLLGWRSDLGVDDVRELLKLGCIDMAPGGVDDQTGSGRIDAGRSLNYLKSPWRLMNHEIATGYSDQVSLGSETRTWRVSPAPGYPPGTYTFVEKIEVRKDVTFPITFASPPYVWGRGPQTIGYEPEPELNQDGTKNVHYAFGWCQPWSAPTTSGVRLMTYVYRKHDVNGDTIAYFPCAPSDVQFAYSVLGQLTPTDAGEEPDVVTVPSVKLSIENPARGKAQLSVVLSQPMRINLDIYNVAGAHVAKVYSGELSAGQHQFDWSGRGAGDRRVSGGLYLAKLQAGAEIITRKILLLR